MSIERTANRQNKQYASKALELSLGQRLLLARVGNKEANPTGQGTSPQMAGRLKLLSKALDTEEAELKLAEKQEDFRDAADDYQIEYAEYRRLHSMPIEPDRPAGPGEHFRPKDLKRPKRPDQPEEHISPKDCILRLSTFNWLKKGLEDAKDSLVGTPEMICDTLDLFGVAYEDEDIEIPGISVTAPTTEG